MKTTTGYSGLQIGLHWLIALLIVTAWFTGEGAEEAMEVVEEGGVAGFVPHVSWRWSWCGSWSGWAVVPRQPLGCPAACR
jgi:hypothetical protein